MKKLIFLLGLGLGFLLGSKAGPGPYARVEAKARSMSSRPEVQEAVDKVKGAAGEQLDAVAHRVGDQVSEAMGDADDRGDGYLTAAPSRPGTRQPTTRQSVSR